MHLSSISRLFLALLASSALACSCGDDPTTAQPGAGGVGAAGAAASSSATSSSAAAGGGAGGVGGSGGVIIPQPCPGWDGWETWDDFAASGTFCVPASAAALPEPIEWEPCDPIVGMPSGCRRMKITWEAQFSAIGGANSGWVDAAGDVFFMFKRNATAAPAPWRDLVVAEADGPVHFAILDTAASINPTWTLTGATEGAGVRQGRFAFTIRRLDINENFPEAVVGGALGELHPKPLHVWDPSNGHAVGVSSGLWATRDPGELRFAAWGEPLGPPITGNGQLVKLFPFGDFAVWNQSPYPDSELWAYKPGIGSYPLVAFGGDPLKNADGFGTDGTHMVWVESQVNSPYVVTPFEVGPRDVMVSPYAETAAALAPVRIRSFPSIYPLITPFAVGCGYAAHGGIDMGQGWLFRLSDGYSWQLPTAGCTPPNISDDVCFMNPLAVTCDEVFVYTAGKITTISRLEIAQLGPPTPPD